MHSGAIWPGAFNRLADNWRPLLAVAQIAGGHWPARALDAFNQLTPTPVGTTEGSRPSATASVNGIQQPDLRTPHSNPSFAICNLPPAISDPVHLLGAIRQIFTQSGATRLFSNQLLAALLARPDCPPDSPLRIPRSAHRSLARALRPFGISPRAMRIGNTRAKGYDLSDFADSFIRFLEHGSRS